MIQQEQDAAIRALRDRLARAKGDAAAIVGELWEHRDACQVVIGLVDGVRGDVVLRTTPHTVPDLPTTARVVELFEQLRNATNEEARCRELLQQAGFT